MLKLVSCDSFKLWRGISFLYFSKVNKHYILLIVLRNCESR